MPANELSSFRENLGLARQMLDTATALTAQLTDAADLSDLRRAALVQGVSAFDHFVHEEVRVRMLALQRQSGSSWPQGFQRFQVSMGSLERALNQQDVSWLDDEIRQQHGHRSFQHPNKVADAVRCVSDVQLWNAVGVWMGTDANTVKTQLAVIVERRNSIVHQADLDPTPPRSRYPISDWLVRNALAFLDDTAEALTAVV